MQVGIDTVIVHMKWISHKVLQSVDGKLEYKLLLYRQAGSHIFIRHHRLRRPASSQIVQPMASAAQNARQGDMLAAAAEFTSAHP